MQVAIVNEGVSLNLRNSYGSTAAETCPVSKNRAEGLFVIF
jgi:hypothetical protein